MKHCVHRISVCVFVATAVWAQSQNNQRNWQQNNDASEWSLTSVAGKSVVSLQGLQHHTKRDARWLSDKGMKAYKQGRYAMALESTRQAAESDGASSLIQNNLGVIFCALGKDQEAEAAFQKAVRLDAGAVTSYSNLASVAFNNYQYRLAETSALQAVRLDPLSANAKIMLALAQVAQGHWTREAHRTLVEYRARCTQADHILQHWPEPSQRESVEVAVKGAGPGAMMRTGPPQVMSFR